MEVSESSQSVPKDPIFNVSDLILSVMLLICCYHGMILLILHHDYGYNLLHL